jgi:DNA-binding transcriptional MocR family regulator
MSFDAWKWVRAQAFTKPLHRYLALEIADYTDKHGKAWPSVETLAKRTLLSASTISRTLAQLEKLGILQQEKRRKNGHQTSNVIRLAMELQPVSVTPWKDVQPVTVTPRKVVQPVSVTGWAAWQPVSLSA